MGQFSAEELFQWQMALAEANRNNILCHCKQCDLEWVSSSDDVPCENVFEKFLGQPSEHEVDHRRIQHHLTSSG